MAFVGGIDLTVGRWDTPEHFAQDPRRTDGRGDEHAPFHDAQVRLTGELASKTGELFRKRWLEACGEHLPLPLRRRTPINWSEGSWGFTDIRARLLRTDPNKKPYSGGSKSLHRQIRSAKSLIYIENQYLTSPRLAREIAHRLSEPNGPDVIIITPREPSGWAEEVTVGMLRWRVVSHLQRHDKFNRLAIYYLCPQSRDVATYVHIKLMIVDDVTLRGEGKISRRSLHVDSELDVLLEANDPQHINKLTARVALIAEHLDLEAREIGKQSRTRGLEVLSDNK